MIDKAREIALKVLYEVNENGAYSNIALDRALKEARKKVSSYKINQRDIGLISEIVYGTISWRLTIDKVIEKYSNLKKKKMSPWIFNILRMGIYQIVFLDKVPKSAAVNESVNLAKRYGHKASSSFVNAVLRKVEKKDYEQLGERRSELEKISVMTSMPKWIVEKLSQQNTLEQVQQICQQSNGKPKLYIRVNRLKNDKKTLLKELEKEKVKIGDYSLKDDFIILEDAKNIESFASYQEGRFSIQDKAAGYIPKILNPKPNEKVLDACSSPGGKTTYMAELMNNKGEIQAWDLYEHRVKLIEKATKRLGITNVKTKVKDARIYNEELFQFFDKVLLDVPCLGLGVLKRKPDIKWKRKKEDLEEITKMQTEILETCSKYLKSGGELVYATCSILKEENEERIQNFLREHPNFKIQKNIFVPEESYLDKFIKKEGFVQIYPNEETDGFFICKMQKL